LTDVCAHGVRHQPAACRRGRRHAGGATGACGGTAGREPAATDRRAGRGEPQRHRRFVGAEYRFDNLRSGGLVLDFAQATTDAGSDFRQLTAYLVRRIDRTLTARGYAILGLSDSAPDWGLGIGFIYYWR